ncbi:nicotinate phosphoribosyltransferase [bacterium M00.F.Ca.ET.228.01.1.1]|uniref:nicotinate phosphoribosyltransferase n=1 Tax=Paraburkholderia phenoliruptrix TaxID=252970 RepID=UPI0010918BE5|nr:nicotinate phosphoribosyltransferase [Paraburkholderia phenoliruptrix]TGP47991.1 nicotinate phosphoribosyltransferase [bacterium M00.F.Ca.ET.228.01.1.1]TGS05783.1 nicotinate phosphoribosyltransferase [bacterium M00.F.Ca.ET.191.01.1.1]TGU10720.1 nicotinate phosphoribosyltransferase [bacterium M00.F.Ca.ET.155.01.1.1]MBW0445193.1 nicotinate phosphoribosyltransferase [Paraburkholderia phenoliruptrix]MBW9095958.1 nicotinate phosphoribosyltransferase [Paraburkholderia phenoliruptrix]
MNAPAKSALTEKNGLVPFNLADFYKTGHPSMYPQSTSKLVANLTPRSAKYAPVLPELFDGKVVVFGLQGFIKEFFLDVFQREFFGAKTKAAAVRKYKRRMDNSLGKDAVSASNLEALYELGYLPLEIRALPEGSRVNIKVPPYIFINTHSDFPWVATYFETIVSCENWKPSTVATIAFEFRKLLTYFAKLTGSPEEFVDVQGHDFSMRGMSGVHDAMRCGAGHDLSFVGTDTIPSIDYLEDYYCADSDRELVGCSIPATEHSVMTLRILLTLKHIADDPANAGKSEKALRRIAEREVIRELITKDYPAGMISIVADSFDYWNTVTAVARDLREVILSREPNELGLCKVVFRPDSGNPVLILTGYFPEELVCDAAGEPIVGEDGMYTVADGSGTRITEAERKGSVECLWDIFGGTTTARGFRVLDSHVGLIYGDSISLPRARDIMLRLARKGFASCNVVLGIGSYTYNMLSRDTFGWAMKAIYAEVGNESIAIYKDPATDDGTKKSAKGLLRVEKQGNDYVLHEEQTLEQFESGELVPVFRNGELLVETSLAEMRARIRASWTCPEPGSIEWAA